MLSIFVGVAMVPDGNPKKLEPMVNIALTVSACVLQPLQLAGDGGYRAGQYKLRLHPTRTHTWGPVDEVHTKLRDH